MSDTEQTESTEEAGSGLVLGRHLIQRRYNRLGRVLASTHWTWCASAPIECFEISRPEVDGEATRNIRNSIAGRATPPEKPRRVAEFD